MDQDRLKQMYEKVLETSFDKPIMVKEFRALQTHEYDTIQNKWVPDSYSVFVLLDGDRSMVKEYDITVLLEGMFGFECVIDFL